MEQQISMESLHSKEILQAVGALFLTAAASEVFIGLQLLRVLSHPRPMDYNLVPAVSGTEVKVRLDIIRVTSAMHKPACGPMVSRACGKLQDAFGPRNDIAHNMGMNEKPNQITVVPLRLTSSGKMTPQKPYHLKQIRMFSWLLERRTEALSKVLTDAGITPLP